MSTTSSDIQKMEQGIQALMLSIDKDKRQSVNKKISAYLKKSYQNRIQKQQDIQGASFKARAPLQEKWRTKKSLAKHRRKLLAGLGKSSSISAHYTKDRVRVGYNEGPGKMGLIAKWQNEGVTFKVRNKNGKNGKSWYVTTPKREFAGISDKDWQEIKLIIASSL